MRTPARSDPIRADVDPIPPAVARACDLWLYEPHAGRDRRLAARAVITDHLRANLAFDWDSTRARPGCRNGRPERWSVYLNADGDGPAFIPRPLARSDLSSLNYCDRRALAGRRPLLEGEDVR